MNDFVYTPIVKTKRGEAKALIELDGSVRKKIIPFFDVLALKADSQNGNDVHEHMVKQSLNIIAAWKQKGLCYVDLFDVTPTARGLNGSHPATIVHEKISSNLVDAIPVVGIERDIAYKLAIRSVIASGVSAIAIRLDTEDIQLPSSLSDYCSANGIMRTCPPKPVREMSRFHPVDRQTGYLLPPSVDEWLPEDHLARFIVEVVDRLDVSALEKAYAGRGSAAYHPSVLLSLLVYGYATGVFSSRKLERATYDSVAFRFIAAGTHPDHDTLATFRRRFLDELAGLFVQVLEMAREMKLLKLGTLSLDGTKVKANASRHSALSHGHIEQLEIQLKAEVASLLALAEQADQSAVPDGMNLPAEIARRQARLEAMAAAKVKIEERAKARFEKEQAEYEAKLAHREQKAKESGKKPGGKPPKPPVAGPKAQDQLNLTDEQSRIMPVPGGGFNQAYNAQAAVDTSSMLVVSLTVTQACNDKEQVVPMLAQLAALPASLGQPKELLADTGFYSAKNVEACEACSIDPFIAVKRDEHHPAPQERFTEPAALPADATPAQVMAHKLKTKAGRALYALRKQTVEPVFGIIKSVLGFRQFSLRGLKKVSGEWTLVCLAWNLKRMAVLRPQ
jgi:transposase